jgi:zinc-ribbon domain
MSETPARYCGNCGNELRLGDQFCHNCGTPVHQSATVPTPEADVPVPPPPQAVPQEQRQLVVVTQPKSMAVAYALWFFWVSLACTEFTWVVLAAESPNCFWALSGGLPFGS